MKLHNVVAVMSAGLIGVTASGFAQAAPGDGHGRGDRSYSSGGHGGGNFGNYSNRGHRGGSSGRELALGIGIIGAAIASQAYSQSYVQPYAYAPAYPSASYRPGYGYGSNDYQYSQRGYSQYGHAQPGYSRYRYSQRRNH